ncbi:hypothetical protein WH52_07955 [Tenacibaculum holothuriorum]|uniref:Right handed beta helix domain-containing protein n=1 Tax=Tenacibaculum holothuriorum TaxID=1635173 RepID=A0A1Y2PBW6_9FLAO|nr:hypothetical protein [Tenacibaculum holothuriorum]OSY87962.1 hypothetical protein WH52_07955 [Tenacibaculum holothuriorum]
MRYLYTLLIISFVIVTASCRKDFSTVPSFGELKFSKDTVFLDTVFTNIGSATYNLKVYNRSNKAITIPEIKLKNGTSSNYRLNVDGKSGKVFPDVDILANDSIFIFIETTINFNNVADPLYTDQILFDNGNNQQDVDLVTLVKDAHFIFPGKEPISMKIDSLTLDGKPTRIKGRFLTDSELTFTKDKPYVIYGYAAIPEDKTLTIEAGTKIHFHRNSGLIVDKKASLKVNGTLNDKVTFQGDRLEHRFDKIPGQWGTIWLRPGSNDSEINHAIIKNGIIGIWADNIDNATSSTLTLKNTEIYNNSNYGILGRSTNILGENLVIGKSGQSSLACTIGGTYNFTHSTFANYWNSSLRDFPAVIVNNHFTYKNDNGQEVTETKDLNAANFTNCIIEGNNNIEFILDKVDGSVFNYNIRNCLIQFNDINNALANNEEMNFGDTNHYQNIIINGNPNFRDASNEDLIIGKDSDAINKAISTPVSFDILGVNRTTNPDIGAYQHITFD